MTGAADRVLAEADGWLDAGRPEQALARLGPHLAASPDDPAGLGLAARALLASGRADEGLAVADRAVAAAPHDVGARAVRYQVLLALGRHVEAAAVADSLVADDPRDPAGHVARAAVDIEADTVDERTEAHAREALALDPEDLDHHLVFGVVRESRGDPTTAAQAFRHVLAIRPDDLTARRGLARLAGDARDRDAQVRHLGALGRLAPRSPDAGIGLLTAFLRVTGRILLLLTLAGLLAIGQRVALVVADDPDRSAGWTTATVSTVVVLAVAALTAWRAGPAARRMAREAVRALPLVRWLVAGEVTALLTVWVSAAVWPAWFALVVAVVGFLAAVGLVGATIGRGRRAPSGWLTGSRFAAGPR